MMGGGVHIGDEEGTRASKEHPKSLTPSQSLERLAPDFLRPMLERRISGACKAALPEGSSAVTPSVPKATLQCRWCFLVFEDLIVFLADSCSLSM